MKKQRIDFHHIKLLNKMYVRWNNCEFGAPEIDPKRPYGNSNIYIDMINILGLEEKADGVFLFEFDGEEYYFSAEDKDNIDVYEHAELVDKLYQLHKEMKDVVQIVLRLTGKEDDLVGFDYIADDYMTNWRKA